MVEKRERSTLFKFFYIILRVITFPLYVIFYILMYPMWFLFVVFLAIGGAIYYPMSQGVEFDNITDWYKEKYKQATFEAVAKAKEKGMIEYMPEAMMEEVKKVEVEAMDAKISKGENYNDAIARDDELEEAKVEVKKRSGFKARPVVVSTEESETESEAEEENKAIETETESALETLIEEASEQIVEAPVAASEDVDKAGEMVEENLKKKDENASSGGLSAVMKNLNEQQADEQQINENMVNEGEQVVTSETENNSVTQNNNDAYNEGCVANCGDGYFYDREGDAVDGEHVCTKYTLSCGYNCTVDWHITALVNGTTYTCQEAIQVDDIKTKSEAETNDESGSADQEDVDLF